MSAIPAIPTTVQDDGTEVYINPCKVCDKPVPADSDTFQRCETGPAVQDPGYTGWYHPAWLEFDHFDCHRDRIIRELDGAVPDDLRCTLDDLSGQACDAETAIEELKTEIAKLQFDLQSVIHESLRGIQMLRDAVDELREQAGLPLMGDPGDEADTDQAAA